MPYSWVNTEYSIHHVQHHPKINSLTLPASFPSLGGCCTQLSTFPQLHVTQWIESQLPSRLPPNRLPPSTPPIPLDHSLQVHLQTRSLTSSECMSKLPRSWPPSASSEFTISGPPSASPNSLDHGLQVYLQTRLITACKFATSWPPCASPNSLHPGLQVHLWVHSISVSRCISKLAQSWPPSASQTRSIKYIFKERCRLYGDPGVAEVDSVTGSIYSADPGVDRHHFISISSYHTMKIYTLSFPTFGLTRSVRDFMDPHNCADPQGRVVSYLLTFLHSVSLM